MTNFFTNKTTTLFCILMLSSNVSFADRFEEQVNRQLENAARTLAGMDGYQQTHDPYINKISTQGSYPAKFLTLKLLQGIDYAILGVCDKDCIDMNLELYDENNNRLDFDYKPDNKPLVKVAPKQTGVFQVKITIPRCKASRCNYGIGVFGKQAR